MTAVAVTPPTPTSRLLVCFAMNTPSSTQEDVLALLTATFAATGFTARLTPVGEWWKESFSASGSYDTWCYETVYGLDYWTRRPRFQGYVLVGDVVGRANGAIARHALHRGDVVLHVTDERKLRAVVGLTPTNSGEWRSEWHVVSQELT